MASKLKDALGLEDREHVALVGGGGKTTLMFTLAEELRCSSKRVVTSTTTKIRHREASFSPCIAFMGSDPLWRNKLGEGLRAHRHVFLAQGLLESGKVEGIDASFADELYQDLGIDYLIVEADGSAGRPVKAPADHEPVISSSVSKVVAMLGLEAIGKPFSAETVFRTDLFRRLTGLQMGQTLSPAVLAKLFLKPEGPFRGTPQGAKRMVFLNKLDLLTEEEEARDLAHLILNDRSGQTQHVVIGSIKDGVYLSVRRDNERNLL